MPGETNYTIEQAEEIMRHVIAHMIEGGSFRSFIYDRLGFGPEGYVPLFGAGVMEFTNACPVNMQAEIAPTFAWAGAHEVLEVGEKGVTYEYLDPFNNKVKRRDAEIWPGQEPFEVGEICLIVYLSAHSGRIYALKSDKHQHYAAWRLVADA